MKSIHRRHNPRHRHQGSMRRSISRLRLSHQSVNAPSNSIISPTSMKLTTLMIPPKRSLSIAPLQKPDVIILVRSILPSPPLNTVPTLQRRSRSADNFSKITNPQNVSGFSNQSPQRRNRQSSNLVVPTNLKPNIIPTTSMLRPMTLRTTLQSRPLKISNPQRSQPQPRQNSKTKGRTTNNSLSTTLNPPIFKRKIQRNRPPHRRKSLQFLLSFKPQTSPQ